MLVLFCLALIIGTAGLTAVALFKNKYEKIAAEFDLDLVSHMEAASVLFDRQGREIGKIFIQNRNPVGFADFSPHLVDAVLAAEDTRFYEHEGVDWFGIARAAFENWRKGRIVQGASTITQQLARNSFDMRARTFERKFIEMFLAQRIEKKFSKQEILEMYLNRVYFGSGFYGAEAASRGYFGKPASQLSPGEAAMLAGLLRSPQALSPWNNYEEATNISRVVLRQMRDQNMITREELQKALETPLPVLSRSNPHRVSYANDMIRQQAIAALGFEEAMNGGFRIFTTLDMDLQQAAEEAMLNQLQAIEQRAGYGHETYEQYRRKFSMLETKIDQGDPALRLPPPTYLQGALLALDNATGGILAMVGGRDFRHSEYNRVTQARRPAGTVFTPFVYAAGYDSGLSPASIVDDACIDNRFVMVGGATGILGEWGVEQSANSYEGPMTARESLVKGKNAAAVRFGFQLGLSKLKDTIPRFGIQSPLREYANSYLGSSEMTLDELSLGFSTFANQGRRPDKLFIVNRIENGEGEAIFQAVPKTVVAVSSAASYQTHLALEEFVNTRMAEPIRELGGLNGIPAAGKSGTAYGFTDTYFIGYTSGITCGVWVGFDKPTRIFRGAFGKDLAFPVWCRFIQKAAQKIPATPFRKSLDVEPVEICSVSGLVATPKCRVHQADGIEKSSTHIEYLTPAQKPEVICDVHAGGVRNYAKSYDQEEWPRAAPAIDLSRVRPIGIQEPTLLGFNDVYSSVQPGALRFAQGEIPVAKALPVEFADGSTADAQEIGETPDGIPVAVALPVHAESEDREVRRAEGSGGFLPIEQPAIRPSDPPPSRF